jgi:hypothetical protein
VTSSAGTCQPTGYCSFVDGSCTSGWRYDDLAAPEYANACVGDSSGSDGGIDTAGCWPFVATNLDPCALGTPQAPFDLTQTGNEYDFDTGNGMWRYDEQPITGPPSSTLPQLGGGPSVRVLHLDAFGVASGVTFKIKGPAPLIVVVHGSMTVAGTVLVEAGKAPPGPTCGNATNGAVATGGGGAGGGGGGGFGTDGAIGGDGGSGLLGGSAGTTSGAPASSPLRGGCDGALGGAPAAGGPGGDRGQGGGALQLIVHDTLTVTGRIDARGRKGKGGALDANGAAGGGGGGAGGTLFLEAHVLSVDPSASVCANGASGGEGGSTTALGADGDDGSCSATAAITPDQTAGGGGGAGAFASTSPTAGGPGTVTAAGGGGGGGAVGRIRLRGTEARTISPAATVTPAAVP